MEKSIDYYAVLGVDTKASSETIKKAFKHLALQYHPDVYKGADAEDKMREILLAYKTLNDPERRRLYDLSSTRYRSSDSASRPETASSRSTTDHTAHTTPKRAYVFPPLMPDLPAQIDLGDLTYLLSPREVHRLKEDGMLRGSKTPAQGEMHYCHRCHHRWQASGPQACCPNCQARDWSEYLLLRCQHCQAVFESEQIRYEIGTLQYGDGALCPPYELFPLCPQCGKAEWCPAEEARLWNVRDRAAKIAKWRRRFGLK